METPSQPSQPVPLQWPNSGSSPPRPRGRAEVEAEEPANAAPVWSLNSLQRTSAPSNDPLAVLTSPYLLPTDSVLRRLRIWIRQHLHMFHAPNCPGARRPPNLPPSKLASHSPNSQVLLINELKASSVQSYCALPCTGRTYVLVLPRTCVDSAISTRSAQGWPILVLAMQQAGIRCVTFSSNHRGCLIRRPFDHAHRRTPTHCHVKAVRTGFAFICLVPHPKS
jgi:hypothetical protein